MQFIHVQRTNEQCIKLHLDFCDSLNLFNASPQGHILQSILLTMKIVVKCDLAVVCAVVNLVYAGKIITLYLHLLSEKQLVWKAPKLTQDFEVKGAYMYTRPAP